MGLSVTDIYNAISLMLAPVYVNDFTDGGRVKRVTMQADSEFRTGPDSLSRFYTPAPNQSDSGEGTSMIPISNVVDSQWTTASPSLSRYNGYAAVERSEEHTSELQSLMRNSYAVFCLKKQTT